MFLLALAALLSAALQSDPARTADVRGLQISAPVTTRTLAKGTVKGTPTRFCPSPGLSELSLRFSERDRWGNEAARHFLLTLRGKESPSPAPEPAWAQSCWSRKSGPESPVVAGLKINVETRQELVRTTNVPREGGIGQHTADPNATPADVAGNAAMASQKTYFEEFRLLGHVVGKAINRHVVPGGTFGWAPAPHALIAFVNDKGQLFLMDSAGRTRQVPGVKKASLPVWSEDGGTLLFLEQKGGGKYEVRMVMVK